MGYSPEAEALDICRDLIRIDTSNYGDDSGPGERKAAEYVAASLAEVGIESEIFESESGRASLVARWGNQDSSQARTADPRTPRRRPRAGGGLAGRPVRRRGRRRLPVRPRRGRHEGLRRDAAVGRTRPAARRRDTGPADHVGVHRRRGGRGSHGRALAGRAPPRPVRRLHRGDRRGRRVLDRDRRQAALPDRVRREGHRVDAASRPRHRRTRLDAQCRQRHHPPGPSSHRPRRARVAGRARSVDGAAARQGPRADRQAKAHRASCWSSSGRPCA